MPTIDALLQWAAIASPIGLFVLAIWQTNRITHLGRKLAEQNETEPTHKKYIGLDEYRSRQQRQRYRDRVS